MSLTKIANELEACRNARPVTESEVDALLVRIDAAGESAAKMPYSKLSAKLCNEASNLSMKYRGLNLPAGDYICISNR